MRVGLYGIGGVYNFGCEAIVRGTYQAIKRMDPHAEVVYFSRNHEYDSRVLADLDIEVKEVNVSNSFTRRAINKALSHTESTTRASRVPVAEIADDVDLLFSIGGDIYTIPAVLREKERYPYYNNLVDFCEKVIDRGVPVAVYGASVGPFGSYQKANDYYVEALRKYSRIVCREEVSTTYLHGLGLDDNVRFLPDPALQLRGSDWEEGHEKRYVGLNLSPLSVRELYGGDVTQSIPHFAAMVDTIYERLGTDLLFIPHVIATDGNDDDLSFLRALAKACSPATRDHIVLADCSRGFMGLKPQLRECYFVASARMHCAVNAIDEGVPAIFLSYSAKSIGMCRYVYGDDRWALSLKDAESKLPDLMCEMMDAASEEHSRIVSRYDEMYQYYLDHLGDALGGLF